MTGPARRRDRGPNGASKSATAPRLLQGALEVAEFVNAVAAARWRLLRGGWHRFLGAVGRSGPDWCVAPSMTELVHGTVLLGDFAALGLLMVFLVRRSQS